jgi:uncharacterized protein DUF1259
MSSPFLVLWAALLPSPKLTARQQGKQDVAKLDTAKIERLAGLKGTLDDKEGVFKVTSPRTDVKVSVDQSPLPPFLGLTSWVAFQQGSKTEAMCMGDLVLFQDEVNPVMSALLDSGLAVTALHNHFFFDEPRAYFLHLAGEGTVDALGAGVRNALDRAKEIRAERPAPATGFGGAPLPASSSISPGPVEAILGSKGQAKDGMLKVVIGRRVKMPCGCEAGKEMGVNTWAAFAGSDENAVVDGDFAVLETELQAVLKSLRSAGIQIVAIHHHMTGEEPRMIFLHYWGRGTAEALAKAVKGGLEIAAR